jgi:hypothetical protein
MAEHYPDPTIALGIDLLLTTSEEGGRRTPIGPVRPGEFEYRPNWGFDALGAPPAQSGAPVFSWEKSIVQPGDRVRAVIVPMFPGTWETVDIGSALTMYEGPQVCGHATVVWRTPITWPLAEEDRGRFDAWTKRDRLEP